MDNGVDRPQGRAAVYVVCLSEGTAPSLYFSRLQPTLPTHKQHPILHRWPRTHARLAGSTPPAKVVYLFPRGEMPLLGAGLRAAMFSFSARSRHVRRPAAARLSPSRSGWALLRPRSLPGAEIHFAWKWVKRDIKSSAAVARRDGRKERTEGRRQRNPVLELGCFSLTALAMSSTLPCGGGGLHLPSMLD